MTADPRDGSYLVLVVDDDPSIGALATACLTADDMVTEVVTDARGCDDAMARILPDCVLLDLRLPDSSGLAVLRRIKEHHPRLPVIMLTADVQVDTVVSAMQAGAWDYLTKPFDCTKLVATVRNAATQVRLEMRVSELEREAGGGFYGGMVGESPAMKRLFRQMDRVAASDVTVLVHGESGTGKELVARALHDASSRAPGPFVAMSCAAIPESLAGSELFGHEKGAFTGAERRRIGRLEQADGGTLFLDEVAELGLPVQAKLLRAFQERRFQRVGGNREIASDFRVLAASHRRLDEEVAGGRFREDLFFRIAVFELEVPPLRSRQGDARLLARVFLPDGMRLDPATERLLDAYPWPGNVRELQNAVQHAGVVASAGVVRPDDLPRRIRRHPAVADLDGDGADDPATAPSVTGTDASAGTKSSAGTEGPVRSLESVERAAILRALERTGGNLSESCRLLGIGRTTLYRKLERFGIDR